MGNIFAGSEVVEIGIQIEKNGRDFYNALLKISKNSGAAKIFKFLAGEEEKHIAVFQKILVSVNKYEPAESYPGEYFAYLSGLASEYIFTQKDKGEAAAKNIANDKEAVENGMGFEKDSITFYEGMKKVVPQGEAAIIDQLIVQEKNHLTLLLELKSTLF
jgi:rubrerythrin